MLKKKKTNRQDINYQKSINPLHQTPINPQVRIRFGFLDFSSIHP